MSGVIAYTSAYTLPAMQFVCHLIVMGSTGNNFTAAVPSTTPSPPQHGVQPLPDGYVANPDLGFAYKYHAEAMTWVKALNVCRQEGAQLAVVDTIQKRNYLVSLQLVSSNHIQAGIIRLHNTQPWINVNTGESVSTIHWAADQPPGDGYCANFLKTEAGLRAYGSYDKEDFFCAIPIHVESTKTAN